MKVPLEELEQKALVQWLRLNKYLHFAPINENPHSKGNRDMAIKLEAKAKSMGKLKGVSDIVVFLDSKIMFIELKRKKHGEASDEQKKFLGAVNEYEYAIGCIANGWEEAVALIKHYDKG